ncbi:MAG: hypothetical protein M3Y59_25225 [Myxococcota bacterium]|nr:hypothetical protein [Myxococcota bacterium]
MHIPGTHRSPPEVVLSELKLDPSVLPAPDPIAQATHPPRNVLRNWVPPPFAAAERAAIDCAALEVETVESVEALAAFEAPWQSLADEALEPNPFYEPWMLLPVLRHLPGQRPLFLLIWAPHPSGRKGERLLCGLFPLLEEPLVPRLGARSPQVLSLWKHPYCYLTAPLLRQGVPRETLGAFFNWLSQSGRAARTVLVPRTWSRKLCSGSTDAKAGRAAQPGR